MIQLTDKTDIELMVMKVDREQALTQLQHQLRAIDAEIMKRVEEERKKKNDNT